jgi:hypothetical protein
VIPFASGPITGTTIQVNSANGFFLYFPFGTPSSTSTFFTTNGLPISDPATELLMTGYAFVAPRRGRVRAITISAVLNRTLDYFINTPLPGTTPATLFISATLVRATARTSYIATQFNAQIAFNLAIPTYRSAPSPGLIMRDSGSDDNPLHSFQVEQGERVLIQVQVTSNLYPGTTIPIYLPLVGGFNGAVIMEQEGCQDPLFLEQQVKDLQSGDIESEDRVQNETNLDLGNADQGSSRRRRRRRRAADQAIVTLQEDTNQDF